MVSSVNFYGGLSATQLLSLFGANASAASPSSNATQTHLAQSKPTEESSAGAPNPASAIRAILAQSQIDQSPTSALGGTAPANTQGVTQSLDYLSVDRAPIGPVIVQSAYSEITSSNSVAGSTYNEVIGVYEQQNIINAGESPSSASDASAQSADSSLIQFGRSIANSSVNVGFSVDGLGPMENNEGFYSPVNPQGTFQVELQLNFDAAQGTANEGESCTAGGQDINITGLTQSQAQAILDGFEKATGGADRSNSANDSVYTNTESLSGMDVTFSGGLYQ